MSVLRALRAKHSALLKAQAESYAVAALLGAVEAGPRPDKTVTSTGRHMESTTISRRRPAGHDPGPNRGTYVRPGVAEALRGLKGGKTTSSVVLSVGAPYASKIGRWGYDPVRKGHEAGVQALRDDHAENVRDAQRAKQ